MRKPPYPALILPLLALAAYMAGPLLCLRLFVNAADFIFIISIIVFIHEFGHYIIAKWAGVQIDTFSIGFGRELIGWNDRSGTRWRVSLLPFGGYVKMYGDASEASTPLESIATLPEAEKQKTFHYKPLPKKAAIVAAGPLFNFILSIAVFTFFIATRGLPSAEPLIGEIVADTPAQAAGLKAGDRILTVGGEKIDTFNDIPRAMLTNLGTPVELILKRGDREIALTIMPKQITEKNDLGNNYTHSIIGIKSMEIKAHSVSLPRAVWEATRETYSYCTASLHATGQIIAGHRSARDLQGPLGIAKLSGQAADKGFLTILWFMAILSANLGLVNLFPIPMLDGGHLLYYAIEALQGKPLAKRFQEYGLRIGMAMIAMLMAFAILNDIRNWLLSV